MSKQSMMRRARMRGLKEGKPQVVRVEIFDTNARDAAERWQDYGFAANPVDGEGLIIECGGHTVVMRMDRLAERPALAAHEVSVWHKDGHRITLKDGKIIQVDCDEWIVNAAKKITFNTPVIDSPAIANVQVINAPGGGVIGGVDVPRHAHGKVTRGNEQTDGPVKQP